MPAVPFAQKSVAALPSSPGVYVFLGEKKKILYVGKAGNLRSRVRSYFGRQHDHRLVTDVISRYAREIDFIVTDSEKKALLLENSMIKKHAPRFNVRLRDDKTYFSLRLDLKHEWPWIEVVRKRKKEDGVLYFGPYTSALSCRRTLQFLNTLFPLRTCSDSVLYNRVRPCLSYEIKRCVAPCVGLVERDAYRRIVDQAILFLKGKNTELVAELRSRMDAAAERLEYERAADLRDKIRAIEATIENPHVTQNVGAAFDVVGLYRSEEEVDLVVLFIRDGVLSSSRTFRLPAHHDTDELLRSFLGQFYAADRAVPAEVILPEDCADMDLLGEILSDLRGAAVKLLVPERGEKRRLLRLAERNAELAHRQRHGAGEESSATLEALRRDLDLVRLPRRIECYDISNLMGTHVVGSGVAFRDGRPDKDNYRRYKIRTVEGQDDFASMAEVLRRRLQRGLREDDLPDLIVIDGGRGQLGAVVEVMRELGVGGVDVVGLAKARSGSRVPTERTKERVFKPEARAPFILDQRSEALKLLVRIRDEAHRFAITYHRRLRAKAQVSSILELIPGIGKQKARALLSTLGSVAAVREATDERLLEVKGMTPRLVARLREYFASGGRVSLDQPLED